MKPVPQHHLQAAATALGGHYASPRYSILLWQATICETYSWPPAAPASCFDCTLQLPPMKAAKSQKHSSEWETDWHVPRDRGVD